MAKASSVNNLKFTAIIFIAIFIFPTICLSSETRFYASARSSLYLFNDDTDIRASIKDSHSRFGFEGKETLSNNLTVLGRFEVGVNTADATNDQTITANRLAYVGIKSPYGQLTIGTQWGAYYLILSSLTDQFNTLGARHINPTFRLTHAINYKITAGPTKFIATTMIKNTTAEDKDAIDRVQLGAQFTVGPVIIATAIDNLTGSQTQDSKDGNTIGIGATIKTHRVRYSASFSNMDANIAGSNHLQSKKSIELIGNIRINEEIQLKLAYGQSDITIEHDQQQITATPSTITVGLQQEINTRSRWWIEGELNRLDQSHLNDTQALSIGFRYDW